MAGSLPKRLHYNYFNLRANPSKSASGYTHSFTSANYRFDHNYYAAASIYVRGTHVTCCDCDTASISNLRVAYSVTRTDTGTASADSCIADASSFTYAVSGISNSACGGNTCNNTHIATNTYADTNINTHPT